jgi:predicted amidophosphoribosyltransferase
MLTVAELAAPYADFMLSPRAGPGVCVRCFNLTSGYERCFACSQHPQLVSVVAPISYSVGREELHHALASYKRLDSELASSLTVGIAAILWRHLIAHEACLARAAGVAAFPVVTTVPSSDQRARRHPMGHVVGRLVGLTRKRYAPLLVRSNAPLESRAFSAEKYRALSQLDGEAVLLIDDTWTTGANADSAACALRAAGAGPIAAIVIGRHVNRDWRDNDRRLKALPRFDWATCPLCANAQRPAAPATAA